MIHRLLLSATILLVTLAHAQSADYNKLCAKGIELYYAKQYRESAQTLDRAFAANGGKAKAEDRYNAACSWALAGNRDSAYYHLQRAANDEGYTNYNHLIADSDLEGLRTDPRWTAVCNQVKDNKEKSETRLDKALAAQLKTILENDQKYRKRIDTVQEKYGEGSAEEKELWKTIAYHDSVNEVEVIDILEKRGWPGPEVAGEGGSTAVFLVIQHADIKTQDKYLPMMREAAKRGDARFSSLALLEDRVALRHGNKQIYGSQISMDKEGSYVAPMIDPDHVDDRRASVGLQPLADYLRLFGLTWDLAEYKKQLPELEKRQAAKR